MRRVRDVAGLGGLPAALQQLIFGPDFARAFASGRTVPAGLPAAAEIWTFLAGLASRRPASGLQQLTFGHFFDQTLQVGALRLQQLTFGSEFNQFLAAAGVLPDSLTRLSVPSQCACQISSLTYCWCSGFSRNTHNAPVWKLRRHGALFPAATQHIPPPVTPSPDQTLLFIFWQGSKGAQKRQRKRGERGALGAVDESSCDVRKGW